MRDKPNRAEAVRMVEKELGIPSDLHTGIFIALAAFFGIGARGVPWLWGLWVLQGGMGIYVNKFWVALICAGVHALIAYALHLMARRHGVSDRPYWLWTLAGAPGLLIGWLVMRRRDRAKYFWRRREELIEEEMDRQS